MKVSLIATSFVVLAVFMSHTSSAQQPATVDSKGQHPKVKLEEIIAGHLTELNGRYKLRVTELTYDVGGYIGPHHHVGPGIRCVTSGELTFIQPDKTKPDKTNIYRSGDCFYETGDISHTVNNESDKPVVVLNFEIVPVSHKGGTAIPVPH